MPLNDLSPASSETGGRKVLRAAITGAVVGAVLTLLFAKGTSHFPVEGVVLMAMFGAVVAGLIVALRRPADAHRESLRSSDSGSPLKQAAEYRNAELVREIIAMGVSPDTEDRRGKLPW